MIASVAGRVAVPALKSLMKRITAKVASIGDDAGFWTRVGRRLGLAAEASTKSRIINVVRNNKISTALLLYELGDAADGLLDEWVDLDPEIQQLIQGLHYVNDDPKKSTSVHDIVNYADEFEVITMAIRQFGSMSRFLAIRRAIGMPEDVISTYMKTRELVAVM